MKTLAQTFEAARAENRAALIGFFPAGFPDKEFAKSIIAAMIDGGVDVIEVGLPYSDPIMDGPVIQRANERALSMGFRIRDIFETVSISAVPTLVMSYWNPIWRYGLARFASELSSSGGVGVITPDLIVEESSEWQRATEAAGLDRVFVVAPNTSDERLRLVSAQSSGFVYAASLMGVTGARSEISKSAIDLVARLRAVTQRPIAVGLGISTGDQAREVSRYADGVIVGSAFIKLVLDSAGPDEAIRRVRELAQELAVSVRR